MLSQQVSIKNEPQQFAPYYSINHVIRLTTILIKIKKAKDKRQKAKGKRQKAKGKRQA